MGAENPSPGREAQASSEVNVSACAAALTAQLGLEPIGGTSAEFGRLIDSETERWSGMIRDLGLKAE